MIEDGRWIRIGDLGKVEGLTAEHQIHLLATAMEESALAQALVLIHGTRAGLERYITTGGCVRFDDDGEPVIWSAAKSRA